MSKKKYLICKIAASFLCMLAIGEHAPAYITEIWQFVMIMVFIALLGINMVEASYQLSLHTKKERSGRPSNRALN